MLYAINKIHQFFRLFYECTPCLINGTVGSLKVGAFYFYVFVDSKTVFEYTTGVQIINLPKGLMCEVTECKAKTSKQNR